MILVIIWRSHVPSEKNDEYIYLETHKQETLYYGKEIDTYSWAYIFLEKGAGDNTGKAEDQPKTGIPMTKQGIERKIGGAIIRKLFGK